MREDIPSSIRATIHELSPDALVKLFVLELQDGTIFRLSGVGELTWRGNPYDNLPCHMTEVSQDADGKLNRPKFSFANPEGLFSAHISRGELDNAYLTRYRVLKADLDANNDFKISETFRVSRVVNMGQQIVVTELRSVLDGHQFKLPARAFYPPEFPHVKLQ